MNSLQLTSALNWINAIFLVFAGLVFVMLGNLSVPAGALLMVAVLLFAAPFAWLGSVIEKGRGRTLQTVFSVLSLFNFPIGTVCAVISLWAVWGSEHARIFEEGGAPEADEEVFEAPERDAPADGLSPFDFARQLAKRGLGPEVIATRLRARGLPRDEIETVLNALRPRSAGAAPARPRPARRAVDTEAATPPRPPPVKKRRPT